MMTMPLKILVAEAMRLASGPCEAGHQWESDGGRSCPKDGFGKGNGCSQPVYRCARCGIHDYGDKGGPAHRECFEQCSYEPEPEEAAEAEPTICITDPVPGADAMKPLFIPLKTAYYDAFADGSKRDELRRYGPRWNENTCAVGRAAVLSKGYGKKHRMAGRIWKFKRQHGSTFGSTYQAAILDVYGTLDVWIACIAIEVTP